MAITFTLNGKPQTVEVSPDMPLLWVLRDTLNMTGTKFGCGMALCGACTVHINGEAARSCIAAISSVAGKKVTTIEGISADGSHPVQQAWMEEDVPQCGYCQSGQIMSAVALLSKKPNPTDSDIDDFMSGNICRCGTYQRIRKAIHRAASMQAGKANSAAECLAPLFRSQRILRCPMALAPVVNRHDFLKKIASGGAALVIGFHFSRSAF